MKGVTKDVISEVRARASLQEVISEVVVLKRSGKEFKGLCPFHKEKTPSFHVNTDKGIFKCFGCNEGGDVFAFVQKTKGVGFYEAVRDLAHKYGVQLVETEEEKKEHDKRNAVFMLYEQACVYYQRLLKDPTEGASAREYLKDRGINEETIEKFRIGYASNTWDGLLSYLTNNANTSAKSLEEAGLVRMRQSGTNHFDLFRNRLMIPICDERGRVIAFGGRTLGDDQIKYLNSPETPIYHKGKHLFGLNLAKEHIKKKDSVIVAEGYFDAITPHQFGFSNTVATLGTALTSDQAKLLVRYTDSKKVYLSFDADEAGQRAVQRGIETWSKIAQGIGIKLRVIRIPGGKDPDECLTKGDNGDAVFGKAIEEAPLLIEYQIDKLLKNISLDSHVGKIEAARSVVPVLASIKNAVERAEYIRETAERIRVSEEELFSDIRVYRRENKLDTGNSMNPFSSQNYQSSKQNKNYGNFKNKPGFKNNNQFGQKGNQNAYNRQNHGFENRNQSENRPLRRGSTPQGFKEAEKNLLSLYLTSKEDYKRVFDSMLEDHLLTPEHQKIKETIEGIGTNFDSVEDLRGQLQDRLAPDDSISGPLTEIIFKSEQIQKQNLPVDVVVMECKSRILKERLTSLTREARVKFNQASDEGEEIEIQTAIRTLIQLTVELESSKSLKELDSLRNKIKPLEDKYIQRPNTESLV